MATNASCSGPPLEEEYRLIAAVQIANVSSTLGSIGDKAQYIKNDEARKANPFASKIVAYKMAKVKSSPQNRFHTVCADGHQLYQYINQLYSI